MPALGGPGARGESAPRPPGLRTPGGRPSWGTWRWLWVRSWEAGSHRARDLRDTGLLPGSPRGASGAASGPSLCLSGLTDCPLPSPSLPFSLDFPANIRGLGGVAGSRGALSCRGQPHPHRTPHPARESAGARRPGTSFPSHGSAFWEIPRTSTSNSATELCTSAVADLTSRTFCSLIYSIRSLCYGYSASSLQECWRFFKQASSPKRSVSRLANDGAGR